MRIIHGIENIKRKLRRPIVTIGVFDGVHIGHRILLKGIVRRAKKLGGTGVVVTFAPHPLKVLNSKVFLPLLTSAEHRLKLMDSLGVDVCLVIPFTKEFSKISPENFVENILVKKVGLSEIFVGFDFTFGRDKKGGVPVLKELGRRYGFKVKQIRLLKVGGKAISSTQIRLLIERGELKRASKLLGRPVSILGTVVKGDARGRLIGFPTANIDPHHETIPPSGVYAVKVKLAEREFSGILNIGKRPTFKPAKSSDLKIRHIEVHIFNFNEKIYGEDIEINFIQKLREEKKFSSKEELRKAIKRDETKARCLLTS